MTFSLEKLNQKLKELHEILDGEYPWHTKQALHKIGVWFDQDVELVNQLCSLVEVSSQEKSEQIVPAKQIVKDPWPSIKDDVLPGLQEAMKKHRDLAKKSERGKIP